MDKNREARRGVTMAASNGLSRRRHRSNILRDSPVEDGLLDLRETARLRDRKKDRDRDRDRDHERERDRDREPDRERERDMLSRISKRMRSDKFMHGSRREDGGDDTSEESVNDDEDDNDDDGGGRNSSSMRILPPNPSTSSSSMLNHHKNNHFHFHHNSNNHNSNSNNNHSNHIRRSFPPPAKVFRVTPPSVTSSPTMPTTTSTWKADDEMIGVSVPRKARSASTKRSHDWAPTGGPGTGSVGEEKIHRKASTSPVRPSVSIVMATPAPASPSSNGLSVKKKMKPNGPKLRPPKSSSNKSSSSAQDEIEIEIAEVLYGMMRQPQGPSKQEIVGSDSVSMEIGSNNNIKSRKEAKSRVSSPISNSPSALPLSSSILPTGSSSSIAPMADIAAKSKRPWPIKYDGENPSMFKVRNSPILATIKNEMDQSANTEPSQNLEKHSATGAAENGSISHDLVNSQASELQLESKEPDNNGLSADSKGLTEESASGRGDLSAPKEEPQSPKKESAAGLIFDDDRRDNMDVTKANSIPSEVEIQREEKFQIDLIAPPLRSSRARDAEIDSTAVDLQPRQKPAVKEDGKEVKTVKDNASVEAEDKNSKTIAEESESQKAVVGKERNSDLHLDSEKSDGDNGSVSLTGNKVHQHVQKKPQQPPVTEKTAQSISLPFPISMASWPGGLPQMGYVAPLQGVVSMDGSAVSSSSIQPPHLLSSQPRPKRCATHYYVARNIHYHQQFMKMYPFWPAAAGSASLYGAKAACNLNVVSPTELHGTFPGRGVNTVTDKGQNLAIFPSHAEKDSKSSQPATIMDAAQRKQTLLQQALPPGVPSNILHAPAFIFPMSQQQAPAAAVRPGSVKSPSAAGKDASSSASNSAIVSASASAGTAATTMSFNYPNMSGNETQYLAILQKNGYPFPIAAHVGLLPAYRGTHAQAMPFFNGSFYSSQMLHPSQFQPQQQQQPSPTQSQQTQQGLQNTSISSGSSSSQKHLQNQQQSLNSSGINGSSVTLQGFSTPKNQAQVQLQQRQQQNQQVPHQARQHESEVGGKESPSTADGRVSHANMNIYGQNFAMPLRPPNFALMTTGPTSTSERKPQQQQSSKAGVESLKPQTVAMTFASVNGAATAPGFDISSIAQNPALLQSLPEAVTHGYHIMVANQAAQQNKSYRVSEEVKTGGNDPSNAEEVRKSTSGKPPATVAQSIAFSRQDFTDAQVSAMTGNTILDSSTQALNLGSVPAQCNVSVMPASMSNSNGSAAQQQLQRSQQHHQQMMQIQKQQQFAAAAAAAQRSKNPSTTCGSVRSEHLHASSVAANNAFSVFPQNLVQSSSSQAQSLQWKNSGRTNTSQINSQSLSLSTTSSLKNLPHQQGRNQQGQTQISFSANPKSSSAQGQTPRSNNQSASPPVIVGSPRSSSISKTSAIGSQRTTATTSRSTKCGQISLSSQQAKNSSPMPSWKSSPVPSVLGNPNISSSSSGGKQQMSEQQQQQLSKHAFQQAQLFFSNAAYMQAQAQNAASTTSSASAPSTFFIQRHREQQQPGSLATSSSGMLSLCPPVTHSNSGTSDPDKAVTAACNIEGLSSHGLVQTGQFTGTQSSGKQHQLVPPGFQNVHAVPTLVQVKPSEQKQPAGE